MTTKKLLALIVAVFALAVVPLAGAAAGLKITTTPSHQKVGKLVEMRVAGLKPGEKLKVTEVIPSAGGQKRTLYPRQRASASGVFINTVKAQVKGRHNWTYQGRTSHRKGSTYYVVR